MGGPGQPRVVANTFVQVQMHFVQTLYSEKFPRARTNEMSIMHNRSVCNPWTMHKCQYKFQVLSRLSIMHEVEPRNNAARHLSALCGIPPVW